MIYARVYWLNMKTSYVESRGGHGSGGNSGVLIRAKPMWVESTCLPFLHLSTLSFLIQRYSFSLSLFLSYLMFSNTSILFLILYYIFQHSSTLYNHFIHLCQSSLVTMSTTYQDVSTSLSLPPIGYTLSASRSTIHNVINLPTAFPHVCVLH